MLAGLGRTPSTWYIDHPSDRDDGIGRKAVDKKVEVGYEGGMAENTQTTDLVRELLAATFGPNTAAEVVKDKDVETSQSLPETASTEDALTTTPGEERPAWWKRNLDGSWRKRCQAPEVLKGVPHGETRQRETDLLMLKALHDGCETLVELVAHTGCVKVTVVRSLERLVEAGRVVQSKAAPTGRRGRPAFIYRPTTTPPVETSGEAV